MMTRSHVRKKLRSLKLISRKYIRMTFDETIRQRMRNLWIRKRVTDPELENLGDFYEAAFEDYLFTEKVPKQVHARKRTTARLHVRESVAEQVKDLHKIAIKRQQPLCVVIEEALERYLNRPENYLGSNQEPKQRIDRIV
jgi:hypothetical protein